MKKQPFIKATFIACYILLVLVLASCDIMCECERNQKHVEIDQDVTSKSILNDNYYVSTYVYVFDGNDKLISMEMWLQETQPLNKVDSCKSAQAQKAELLKIKLENQLKYKH